MSTHWDLHCESCDERLESGHTFATNHAQETFARIASVVHLLGTVAGTFEGTGDEAYVNIACIGLDFRWLFEHKDCVIQVRSEYGQVHSRWQQGKRLL